MGRIFDGSWCAVANDSYHLAKKDVELLKVLGAKAYRFSIAWTTVIPKGDYVWRGTCQKY
jgi:beta-glucosidase/6-phospho-beta-glucosidase/beta-galactosidase